MNEPTPTPTEAVLPGIPIAAGTIVITPVAASATVPAPVAGRPEDKLPSQTTPEEDRTTASQRRVNLIWETTQSVIAISVTIVSLIVAASLCIRGTVDNAALQLLSNAFFLIIGFYFSRTNHTKTGGVGAKDGKER